MRKQKLEQNILPKAKQRFLVQGYPDAEILSISRDVITSEIGVIELPDQTRVPGGRRRAGDFTINVQFGRDEDRELFSNWYNLCMDQESGDNIGVNPAYKRNATLIYLRLFSQDPGEYDSGRNLDPVIVSLTGCWPSSLNFPDYDMTSDEGDGYSQLELTINYDDVQQKDSTSLSQTFNG